ncbi:MAG TPA: tRNA pseudouridine(38-40) synthase TruA [Salinimicrobium sp.]|nr:tRNA pseudouridine(38-40) synthase TruA [Salinimicrobium sp.]
MQHKKYYYLIKVQFLGYRLHGWQKQPGFKTVEGLIKKTLQYVFGDRRFKILGAGRTDAMVSAQDAAFELFIEDEPLYNTADFLKLFNKNLPPDIRATSMKEVTSDFNIIKDSKIKEYAYFFSFGKKNHPFCAPFMANFPEELDIETMKKAAKLFEGTHNFRNYCVSSGENSKFEREVVKAAIEENNILTANFFPEKSYVFHVHGSGFLRYQVRLMMGALIQLGRGEILFTDIQESLQPNSNNQMTFIAPASGLMLNKIDFDVKN